MSWKYPSSSVRDHLEPDHASLERIGTLVAGRESAAEDTALPRAEAGTAHEPSEQGRTQGKIVLRVSG